MYWLETIDGCVPVVAIFDLRADSYLLRHILYTVELQWFEHFWNHERKFETGVVPAIKREP